MINPLKFYRVKDWVKNLGICLIAFLTANPLFNFSTYQQTLLFLTGVALAYAYAFSINDFFDYKLSKETSYIGKLIKRYKEKLVIFLCFIPLFCFFLIFLFLKELSSYLLILFIFLYSLYSIPPFRLKKYYFFSIPINAVCIGLLTYLSAYFLLTTKITFQVVLFSIIFCSYLIFQEIIHQIAHRKRDKGASIYSLPNMIGIKKSLRVAIASQIVPIIAVLLAFILGIRNFIFVITILFSSLRILRVSKTNVRTNFNDLRNKLYGSQEGLSYIIGLIICSYFFIY